MKSFNPRGHFLRAALASALLGAAGAAVAAPSYRAVPDPAFVGTDFSMFLRDDAVDPTTGFLSFDVRVYFDPSVFARPTATAGGAFGESLLDASYDVLDGTGDFGSDGSDDDGWARFSIVRDTRATQPASFGSDILRLDFRLIGLPSTGGSADVSFMPVASSNPGTYAFPNDDTYTASVGALIFVPEPSTVALMLAGLGVLCTRRRAGGHAHGAAGPACAAA